MALGMFIKITRSRTGGPNACRKSKPPKSRSVWLGQSIDNGEAKTNSGSFVFFYILNFELCLFLPLKKLKTGLIF